MRIGLVEFLLILAIASLTIGPQVALFVDRWLRRANRVNARAARRRAEYAAQAAAERDALLKRFRTASTVFGVCILLALVYTLVFRPIDTPPQAYDAPAVRQDTGAAQTALAADDKGTLDLGGYQGVDCIRARDGLVYAAACDGTALKKCSSDLVRTDGGHTAAVLTVDGELTGFAFDGSGDLWLSILTPGGGSLCRAAHDSWGTAVEQVVTQIDGAPLGAVSAVEAAPDGRIYFAVAAAAGAADGLESTLRTELLAHTGTGCVYVYDPAARSVQKVLGGVAPVLAENGIWLAAQCCEHLNRAIIIEREAAEKYGWEEVCVVPRPHAGGSWATTCWKKFREPVAVEEIRAHAGIDIGGTLIGMHLKRVAVPVRLSLSKIGEANILCARTRPKLIVGERDKYTEED